MKHNLLFFHLDWGWVSFFCYALRYGPFLGRFKMVYCAIIFRIICSAYINHFETPTNLSYVRPALPVPRPGRDREARREVDIQLFSLIMNASLYITTSCHASLPWCDVIVKSYYRFNVKEAGAMKFSPCMPGLGQGSGPGPALPVPRPGRDREARRDENMQLISLLMNGLTFHHRILACQVWDRGLGQGFKGYN